MGARAYINTTPLGRPVTGTMLVRAMHEDGVDLSGRLDVQGQRYRAVYSYGLLANGWLNFNVRADKRGKESTTTGPILTHRAPAGQRLRSFKGLRVW